MYMRDASKITVLIVDPDGTRTRKDVDPVLATFQSIIGGWIEAIGGVGWTAYLDEEGKIKGLPVNVEANHIAYRLGWRGVVAGDVLVGPVVFCGPPDDDGYDTSLTPGLIEGV